jgi:hypothetical protein
MAKSKYSPEEIEGIARTAMDTALGSPESDIGKTRQRNIEYYNADPVGELAPPEVADRSNFVDTSVADTVEGMLPQFMDMFVSSDDAVDFEPRNPQDAEQAALAKAYVNHLFYTKNDGLAILYDWFKDALIQKVGFVKVWVEEDAEDSKQRYEGVSEEQLVMLLQDGWELVDQPEVEEETGGLEFTVRKESRTKKIRIAVVSPSSMRVDSNARWDSEPAMIGEVCYKRRFELEQDGYVVDDANEETPESDMETLAMLGDNAFEASGSPHRSHDLIKLEEIYMKLDQDDDGIAEWLKICLIGGKLAIYEDGSDAWEQVDGHPYVWICPIPRPHSFYGDCPADFAIQPQKLKTATVRAIQDNMYLTVNQRTYVNMSADVNVEDILESRPGGIIRGRTAPGEAFQSIVQPNLGAPAYQFNQFLDEWRQDRTGFTKYSQGTDSNSLNKTATGVSIITQKSDLRMKLMARFFAVGVKNLFAKVLKLAITYQNQPEMVMVNGQFFPINPSQFKNDFNMKIKVGLGTGTKEQQSARVQGLLQVMQAGVQMGVVKPENVAEAIKLYVEANEFKNPERFVSPPEPQQGPNPEQVQQGMQMLQEQGQQIQQLSQENEQLKAQLQNKQADTQIKAQDSQVSAELKAQELALKERELALKEQEAQFKMAIEQYNAETQRIQAMNAPESAQEAPEARESDKGDQSTAALIAGFQAMLQPKTSVGVMTRLPDGSYQMTKQENINPQGFQ